MARLADRALTPRLKLEPQAMTRYRVLRRSLVAAIVAFGVLSALRVIPEVRAVAGGILASTAVVGLIIGMAARSTLGNFVSGIMIAFTQPLRLGDEVKVADASGTVQEIALIYTILQTGNGARFYIPNEKLASEAIQNSTIARLEHLAEVTIPVPISSDLDRVLALVAEEAKDAPDAMPDTEPHIAAQAPSRPTESSCGSRRGRSRRGWPTSRHRCAWPRTAGCARRASSDASGARTKRKGKRPWRARQRAPRERQRIILGTAASHGRQPTPTPATGAATETGAGATTLLGAVSFS